MLLRPEECRISLLQGTRVALTEMSVQAGVRVQMLIVHPGVLLQEFHLLHVAVLRFHKVEVLPQSPVQNLLHQELQNQMKSPGENKKGPFDGGSFIFFNLVLLKKLLNLFNSKKSVPSGYLFGTIFDHN